MGEKQAVNVGGNVAESNITIGDHNQQHISNHYHGVESNHSAWLKYGIWGLLAIIFIFLMLILSGFGNQTIVQTAYDDKPIINTGNDNTLDNSTTVKEVK
ncbi:hypothetical protein [Candidatus Albibeggiatoa sp. nov. NOAA]|uniref:hypothetical protein n=1 Tax=Candidatus Albibeggiatoa sp. nov. NOAA TaxID=3162724 RepID=UPI0032F6BBBF|nr:hypothetical protein [Thiotrichaceae bacterium]